MTLPAYWSELKHYPQGVLEEMRKVDWPSRETTRDLTLVVAVVVILATTVISFFDFTFARLMAYLLSL
jgi:preprotein translocase SecE subunit